MTGDQDPALAAPRFVQLSDGVRLRREHFGGLAYVSRTGDTIELDRGAFRLLELASEPVTVAAAWDVIIAQGLDRRSAKESNASTVADLIELGVLQETDGAGRKSAASHPIDEPWPSGPILTAPEAVHWAITYRCPSVCPDCYAARHRGSGSDELSEIDTLRLVDRVADWGAFQLAIGGGEPLVRPDLARVVRHARENGLSVHVTTSGIAPGGVPDELLEAVTCLQIGIRHDELLGVAQPEQIPLIPGLCRRAEEVGSVIGANLMLCRTVLGHLDESIARLVDLGLGRITLLRYKAPGTLDRWLDESPDPRALRGLEARIAALLCRLPGLAIRLDCALAFLERRLDPGTARRSGLRGCVVGSRIVALGPDGAVYPCSQLVSPLFRAGNLLKDDPRSIWTGSTNPLSGDEGSPTAPAVGPQGAVLDGPPNLRRVRNRRAKRAFRQTLCGACRARERCGGCVALSPDGLDADPGCPEPLLPPLEALGRDGRVADLRRHLRSCRSISVGEYMERYGVGQRRAVSELRRFPGLVLDETAEGYGKNSSGRRKADCYRLFEESLVGDIQGDVGVTPAGFPYATREDIEEWIGFVPEDSLFPQWLLEPDPAPAPGRERIDSPERDRDHYRSGRVKRQ